MRATVPQSERRLAALHALPAARTDDRALLAALHDGNPGAAARLFDGYAPAVERTLVRILGADTDVAGLLNDVFVRALARIDRVVDPEALGAWLTRIAVFTAREHIRARRRRSWLSFFAADEIPEVEAREAPVEMREAVAHLYRALDALPVDDRVAFSLRYLEQMELTEVADACDVSLSTVKRRLARAETRFLALSRCDPLLASWIEEGTRWSRR